jgi:hypothetical protein
MLLMQQQLCSHYAVLASSGMITSYGDIITCACVCCCVYTCTVSHWTVGQVASAGTANSAAVLESPPTDNDTDMSDGGDSVSVSKSFEQQVSLSDVRSYSAAQHRSAPTGAASVEQLSVQSVATSSKQRHRIDDASARSATPQEPTVPKPIVVQPPTDSESDGGNSAYSDDSCDENDMMTNVEQVTGFYSRATDRLHRRILHRIDKRIAAEKEQDAQSPRMQELRELLDRARVLSDTMKTKQYKMIVIGKGYGKTDVVNTLCGGMKVSTIVCVHFVYVCR